MREKTKGSRRRDGDSCWRGCRTGEAPVAPLINDSDNRMVQIINDSDYRTMARMRTGAASPGFLIVFVDGATMMSEPVCGSDVKRAAPSTT
jgi:hypothetical protein